MKIFWRVILPFLSACVLATAYVLVFEGNTQSYFSRSWWWRPGGRIMAGMAFLGVLIASWIKAARWGKEAEEYEELLQEESGNSSAGRND